ncbi:HAMP domain-containing sensor histidine kinase [Acetobacterium bakii]|uniref:HAMP domain-containing sensor histidine kinase n=1 Tax=Acetobacterium bakii TaxID=52689 RepID=UPI0006816A61|nr:HAMP domain-containing sensor histidine kinase [Acetobacterium bakii]
MKIKGLIIGFTAVLLAIYGLGFAYISQTGLGAIDVIQVNNTVKTIEKQLTAESEGLARTGAMDGLSYNLVFETDENYNAAVFEAIKNRQTMVDLTVPGLSDGAASRGKVLFVNPENEIKEKLLALLTLLVLGILALVYVTLGMVYVWVLRPFAVMQQFAGKIADGDLEFRLPMDRGNYFGAFTESFDLMREELKKARQGEYLANISKKELVAELSHDIKTPVATIKAICELLQAKLGQTITTQTSAGNTAIKESIEKIAVINTRADTIDALISNLFQATLEELEMLKVTVSEQPSTIITRMFGDINHYGKIRFQNAIPECLIRCDPLRLSQVIDNVISNSCKYADTFIDVRFCIDQSEKFLAITIRDYGPGFETDEGPLLCEKFFRGSGETIQNTPGSGLGLYLARQFMEAMAGRLDCHNNNGFVAELHIKLAGTPKQHC